MPLSQLVAVVAQVLHQCLLDKYYCRTIIFMSRVSELIDLIVQGKNAEASEVLNDDLFARSYQAINDAKPHIAAEYFNDIANTLTQEEPQTEEEVSDETDQGGD